MEEYEQFGLSKFGIELRYPTWWERKSEGKDTYLFWDEYTGSFRITATKMDGAGFDLDAYLESVKERERLHSPAWKTFGERKFLCFQQESQENADKGATVTRFYISGHGNLVIICSFAYAKSLLDDEFTADRLDASLEEVELILDSITFEEI